MSLAPLLVVLKLSLSLLYGCIFIGLIWDIFLDVLNMIVAEIELDISELRGELISSV